MRSHGQIRFVTLTSKMQMLAVGGALAILVAWGGSIAAMSILQYKTQAESAALLERAAKVASAESRVAAYRDDLDQVADDLVRRQEFIESVLPMLPDDVLSEEAVADKPGESGGADKTAAQVSAAIPEASALARLEARQLAFVESLTRFADRRADRAEAAMRQLGLDPRGILASATRGQGGPLEKLSTSRDGSVDPRFGRLGRSLARMNALERGLEGIPQVMPVDRMMISSGFGVRHDPFDGSAAMHSGLDFRGPTGAPIHAAAAGKVIFVGSRAGYGNLVEISHGNGLTTRYAHMSKFKARPGQKVEAGDVIGAIGSTGRSTGPHLHFEVRINNRAVNPRPFLEAAPHVLEEARAAPGQRDAADRG
ncbi:peptidoglycan DD-metalloendopeptidase family protein [Altererythrobacter soli]|uniref:Peptidoglycan DD-metalloendopeptidase family protein n=2 Tax=Croceibacterium soli TaxID=1739690 RepID=A0A6I4URJ9_9SPHN|nr:peptidoglycan DD-metalloendopeptidase family protein [Croceibacterium soli]